MNKIDALERTIDCVLTQADGLCLDNPDDRAALRGLLLSALAPAFADDTDTGARLEAAYNHQLVCDERDRLRLLVERVAQLPLYTVTPIGASYEWSCDHCKRKASVPEQIAHESWCPQDACWREVRGMP